MKSFIQFLKTRILNESISIPTITIPEFDEYVQNLINQTGFNYYQLMSYLLDEEGLGKSSNEDDSDFEQKRIALLNHVKNNYSYLNKTSTDTDYRDTIHSLLPTRTVPTERIEELTQEQRDAIPSFVRSWVNAILNHRTDEDLVKEAFSHLGFNNITFVDSLEGIDDEIVENTRWRQVRNQVWEQHRHQVMSRVGPLFFNRIWELIADRALNQVRGQTWGRFRSQVRNQFVDQLLNQVYCVVISYYENVLNIEITNPNCEHVKDILINTKLIFSTNNQNEIFVLRK